MKTRPQSARDTNLYVQQPQQGDASEFQAEADYNHVSREQMVSEAAYFLAERHGFDPQNSVTDWLQAEADVTALLARS